MSGSVIDPQGQRVIAGEGIVGEDIRINDGKKLLIKQQMPSFMSRQGMKNSRVVNVVEASRSPDTNEPCFQVLLKNGVALIVGLEALPGVPGVPGVSRESREIILVDKTVIIGDKFFIWGEMPSFLNKQKIKKSRVVKVEKVSGPQDTNEPCFRVSLKNRCALIVKLKGGGAQDSSIESREIEIIEKTSSCSRNKKLICSFILLLGLVGLLFITFETKFSLKIKAAIDVIGLILGVNMLPLLCCVGSNRNGNPPPGKKSEEGEVAVSDGNETDSSEVAVLSGYGTDEGEYT